MNLGVATPSSAIGKAPESFSKAKKIAATIFKDYQKTLYCGCKFNQEGKVDLASCRMNNATHKLRAHRIEWEHIVPVEFFGHDFPCWRENLCETSAGKRYHGRACCEKVDFQFRRIESELFNLWPSVGLINQK